MNSELWSECDELRKIMRSQTQTIQLLTERVRQLEQLGYAQSMLISELQQQRPAVLGVVTLPTLSVTVPGN